MVVIGWFLIVIRLFIKFLYNDFQVIFLNIVVCEGFLCCNGIKVVLQMGQGMGMRMGVEGYSFGVENFNFLSIILNMESGKGYK